MYIVIYIYTCIVLYIYVEREREGDANSQPIRNWSTCKTQWTRTFDDFWHSVPSLFLVPNLNFDQ